MIQQPLGHFCVMKLMHRDELPLPQRRARLSLTNAAVLSRTRVDNRFCMGAWRVRSGSWLCENAKTLNRDRRNYSSKTALGLQFESAFNLEIELKNVILVAFRLFAFLDSRGRH